MAGIVRWIRSITLFAFYLDLSLVDTLTNQRRTFLSNQSVAKLLLDLNYLFLCLSCPLFYTWIRDNSFCLLSFKFFEFLCTRQLLSTFFFASYLLHKKLPSIIPSGMNMSVLRQVLETSVAKGRIKFYSVQRVWQCCNSATLQGTF